MKRLIKKTSKNEPNNKKCAYLEFEKHYSILKNNVSSISEVNI